VEKEKMQSMKRKREKMRKGKRRRGRCADWFHFF
jgi:hypothetical protein